MNTDAGLFGMSPVAELKWLRNMLAVPVILLCIGISLPMITVSKWLFFSKTVSLISGVVEMLQSSYALLALVIVFFSAVLPAVKVFLLHKMLSEMISPTSTPEHHLALLRGQRRWAMLDVILVAIFVAAVELGLFARIDVHTGFYVFWFGILVIMLIANRMVGIAGDGNRAPE